MNKNFAIMGASGYIAPRHIEAIKKTNNNLIVAFDISDSVGVLDSYFPNTDFFNEIERFDRHIEKLKYQNSINLDYVSICTPNYFHDSHIRMSLRWGANAICEKPLVLNPWNLQALKLIEESSGKKIYNTLQLRLHDSVVKLKEKIVSSNKKTKYDIDLTYITSRGNWYYTSWKGDPKKSGGIATNIGIHFFDMLIYIFGKVQKNIINIRSHDRASGILELENARVRWFLSINSETLPEKIKKQGKRTFRSITIDSEEFEFSEGFTDLHTKVYENIIDGKGFSLDDTEPSIETAYQIRNALPIGLKGDYHPFANLKIPKHPFLR
ncbi:MAG: oxidoreductase [Flavobacteriales bacterium]|nr:oxidoreductase [Flavobacteriales bacterium]|tara:strand:+ start:1135 stop:2106 length:972 start_codon:yes stop_codon:yes gene_type:complete